jgi:DNA polymerase-3 subunit gamma/tau
MDLIEIDAASNRRLDEMRGLLEKVRFAPTQGRNKVYIIDEAHALTSDAFNAFLKTLEEPPPSTVFILATTDPHLLPPTIISRCQRYDFHRISSNVIAERLGQISEDEGVTVPPQVLQAVARASAGSLRDAINLLDQLITSFGSDISMEQLRDLLGVASEDRAIALVTHLLLGETSSALEAINAAAAEGLDLRPLHRVTIELLRATLLAKVGATDSLDMSPEAGTAIASLASTTSVEKLFRALRIFGQVSLKYDQPSPLPLELATVELGLESESRTLDTPTIIQPSPVSPPPASDHQNIRGHVGPSQQAEPLTPPSDSEATLPETTPPAASNTKVLTAPGQGFSSPDGDRLDSSWPLILKAMSRLPRKRFDIAALLRSSSRKRIDGARLIVSFNHRSHSERLLEELDNPQCRLGVQAILDELLGGTYVLEVEATIDSPTNSSKQTSSHLVRAALSFGGKVVPDVNTQGGSPQMLSPAGPASQIGGGVIITDGSIEEANEQKSR